MLCSTVLASRSGTNNRSDYNENFEFIPCKSYELERKSECKRESDHGSFCSFDLGGAKSTGRVCDGCQ